MPTQITNLETLRNAMIANDPRTCDRFDGWGVDLPAFGGEAPANTLEVWSWDADRLLVGLCADDLRIVSREDW